MLKTAFLVLLGSLLAACGGGPETSLAMQAADLENGYLTDLFSLLQESSDRLAALGGAQSEEDLFELAEAANCDLYPGDMEEGTWLLIARGSQTSLTAEIRLLPGGGVTIRWEAASMDLDAEDFAAEGEFTASQSPGAGTTLEGAMFLSLLFGECSALAQLHGVVVQPVADPFGAPFLAGTVQLTLAGNDGSVVEGQAALSGTTAVVAIQGEVRALEMR